MNKIYKVVSDIALNSSDFANKEIDKLNRTKLAEHIYNLIKARESEDSITVGIIGPWGSGKTSLLNHIKYLCLQTSADEHLKPLIVDFNP